MATKKTNTKSNNTKTKKNTNTKKKNQEQKRNNSTMFFLVVILILLGVIAYAYRDKLEVLYNSTITYINSKDKNDKKQSKDNQLKQSIDKLEKNQSKKTTTTTTTVRKKQTFEKVTTTTTTTVRVKPTTTTTTTTIKKVATTTTTTIKKETANQIAKSKPTKIYFTKVTDDKLFPCTVNRNVVCGDAPLTETINALLQGPTSNEENNDIVTNIPDGTKLLSAYVKGSTAFLNFSSQFENNHFGKEATVYQLYQIVYTATEFDNIKSVQIMINGKIVEYLGGEGVLIGTPLARSDF